jgi:branched-chain amino acid transport system ATP-binding protein
MSPLLQVKNVTKKYGGLTANNAISFDVAQFKMIASFTPTTSGEVIYQGERISNLKPHIVARKGVVRTFQETTIFKSMTVRESVVVAQHLRAKASLAGYFWRSKTAKEDVTAFEKYADELLEFLGMSEISNEQASNLPQGSLRALGIAIGLATDPKVLLLDEPFAGMNHDETIW